MMTKNLLACKNLLQKNFEKGIEKLIPFIKGQMCLDPYNP